MRAIARLATACLSSAILLGAAGCTGGSGGDASVTLAITDAASDELASFRVEITAVQLTRAGGAPVGILQSPVTVDLVDLAEASRVLSVRRVPAGTYSGASITFDFTSAEAYLVGETTPATLLDADGNPLTGSLTLPVVIQGALAASKDRNRVLELDFDLNQSVHVDAPGNSLSLSPAIFLRVDRNDPKETIVAGELLSVDVANRKLRIEVQTLGGTPLTEIEVGTGLLTVSQIDGVPRLGDAGLGALAIAGPGTWVQAYGAVDPSRARLQALYYEAGRGTYNGGSDIVEGFVVGRTGGPGAAANLTVLGHSNDAAHTTLQFNTTFTVAVDFATTKVLQRGRLVACDTDDLTVGQHVRCFGTLSGATMDATGTTDVVRVQPTRVLGFANAAPSAGMLSLDLARVELRDQALFAWSEGGTTPPDPANLMVDVGALASGLGIGTGTAVEALGFFTPVGDAGADFDAFAVVNRDLAPSLVLVLDRPGGQTVTPAVTTTEITLGLAGTPGADEAAVVDRGFVGVTPLPTSPAPTVAPAGLLGLYVIRDRVTGAVQVFLTFDAFAQALDAALAASAVVFDFGAVGAYDDTTSATSAFLVSVVLD